MSWYYRATEGNHLFTVMHDTREGTVGDSDWPSRAEAAARCNYLNGGNADELAELERAVKVVAKAIAAAAIASG